MPFVNNYDTNMIARSYFILALIFISLATGAQKPQVLLMNADRLFSLQQKWKQGDAVAKAYVDSLQKQAGKLLSMMWPLLPKKQV